MIRELCKHFFEKSLRICWLGFAEPLYKEAGAKAPASLSFPLD